MKTTPSIPDIDLTIVANGRAEADIEVKVTMSVVRKTKKGKQPEKPVQRTFVYHATAPGRFEWTAKLSGG